MVRISRLRLALAAVVAVAVAAPTLVGMASAGSEHSLTAATKTATGRYHDLSKAEAGG